MSAESSVSRSELLLRSTLVKDGTAKKTLTHQRRHSTTVHRSASPSPSVKTMVLPRTTSSNSIASNSIASTPSSPPLSPHEQILRARLERVLESTPKERKRSSMPTNSSSYFGWLWRDPNEPVSPSQPPHSPLVSPRTPTKAASASAISPHAQFTANIPVLQRGAWSVDSVPQSQLVMRIDQQRGLLEEEEGEDKEPELLTPPPTPPTRPQVLSRRKRGLSGEDGPRYPSALRTDDEQFTESPVEMQLSTPPSSSPSSAHFDHRTPTKRTCGVPSPVSIPSPASPTPTFNARQASQQCKLIEGYVSFAAVEGLGEPPASACPTNASASSLLDNVELEPAKKPAGWRGWLTPWKQ